MAADADSPTQEPEAEASSRRRGIGLCLSGGGFRATLFHAGVIQRLFELGVAGREEFETVASVSGGSITAVQWAVAEAASADVGRRGREREFALGPGLRRGDVGDNLPVVGGVPAIDGVAAAAPSRDGAGVGVPSIDFVRDVVRPLLALTRRDIRTGAMAQKYLLPWNWFRGAFVVNNMVEKFEEAFGKGTLDLLPGRPRFVGGTIGGAYVGVGSSVDRYPAAQERGYSTQGPKDRRAEGGRQAGSYSKAFAMDVIRNIRTDLDAFSDVEQGVLMNHGYALIDAAIRTHVPELMGAEGVGGEAAGVAPAPFAWPAPEFAPTAMAEQELRRRLAGSEKRKLTGRG